MFFEGKCKEFDGVVVFAPGSVVGDWFKLRGVGGRDWVVKGILTDFTALADKGFLDEIDDDEEFNPQEMVAFVNEVCSAVEEMDDEFQESFGELEDEEMTPENHFGLIRGVNFIVGLMDHEVKVELYDDGTFDVHPCTYGEEPDEVRASSILSESGVLGLACTEDVVDASHCLNGGGVWFVYEGVYDGQVRFVVISGSVEDYDVHAQETVYQYLADALKIQVGMKVVVDELALQEMKMGIQPDEMGCDEQVDPAE